MLSHGADELSNPVLGGGSAVLELKEGPDQTSGA